MNIVEKALVRVRGAQVVRPQEKVQLPTKIDRRSTSPVGVVRPAAYAAIIQPQLHTVVDIVRICSIYKKASGQRYVAIGCEWKYNQSIRISEKIYRFQYEDNGRKAVVPRRFIRCDLEECAWCGASGVVYCTCGLSCCGGSVATGVINAAGHCSLETYVMCVCGRQGYATTAHHDEVGVVLG